MSEKEEVLSQLNSIHSTLVDNEKFLPYNYNVLIMWGFLSAFLFLAFGQVATLGIWYSAGMIAVTIALGFIIEMYFTKKENIKYDIEELTKLQKFIEINYTFSVLFATLLTVIFVSNSIGAYAYISWMFLLGFSNYITGFILNKKRFTVVGLLSITSSVALITISFIFDPSLLNDIAKYMAVLLISGGFIYIGIVTKKEYEVV